MIPLNYHQLYYFWTIAKEGSFRAAGEKLLLAVPTLSLQTTQLEKSFGMRLLNRDRRGVSLTPEGRAIYEHCEKIFTEGEALLTTAKKGALAAPPVLRLGVQESISAWIVLRILDFVAYRAPDVTVSVFGGNQEDLQERLRRRSLDILVASFDYTAVLGREFGSRLAARIPISFVGTPKIKRAIRRFPMDLDKVPMLVRTTGDPIRRTLDLYLREHRIQPRLEIEIDNPLLIRLLALQGRGAAIIDTLTINDDLKARRLVKLHGEATKMEEFVWLLFDLRPRAHPSLAAAMAGLAKDFSIRT